MGVLWEANYKSLQGVSRQVMAKTYAYLKNIKVDKDPDYEVSDEGKEKVSVLAQELSDAIVNWVTKQEFRVDKLSAPVFIPVGNFSATTPIPAVGPPGAPLIQPLTPITLDGGAPGIPFIDFGRLDGIGESDMFVIKSNTAKKTYLKIIEVKDHETQVEIISEQDNMASINGKIVELVVGS